MSRRFALALLPLFFLAMNALSQTPPYGLPQRVPNTSFKISTSGSGLTTMQLRRVF